MVWDIMADGAGKGSARPGEEGGGKCEVRVWRRGVKRGVSGVQRWGMRVKFRGICWERVESMWIVPWIGAELSSLGWRSREWEREGSGTNESLGEMSVGKGRGIGFVRDVSEDGWKFGPCLSDGEGEEVFCGGGEMPRGCWFVGLTKLKSRICGRFGVGCAAVSVV